MAISLAFSLLAAFFQVTTVESIMVTVPPGARVDIPLSPGADEVEARRSTSRTTIEVRIDSIDPLGAFDNTMRAYVVWAVSPEGEFENLGELEIDGREAELDTATTLQRFGLLVTAEPYFNVPGPSSMVAFMSVPPTDNDVRYESQPVEVGRHDYSTATLPPQGGIDTRVTQARMAFRIAQLEGAEEFAGVRFRQARVAVDSMEELLRRQMDTEVLDAYVNDAIRLSAWAIESGREAQAQMLLDTITARAEFAEGDNEQLQQEIQQLDVALAESIQRQGELRDSLQVSRAENREQELLRTEVERGLRTAESEIERLSDPWPPIVDALISAGARQTARGVQVTLTADRFEAESAEFAEGTRELLARLAGIVTFDTVPQIRIDGHMNDSVPSSEAFTLSEERAVAVSNYLFDAGVPLERLRSEGFGISRPAAGIEDRSDPIHARVEIIITEP